MKESVPPPEPFDEVEEALPVADCVVPSVVVVVVPEEVALASLPSPLVSAVAEPETSPSPAVAVPPEVEVQLVPEQDELEPELTELEVELELDPELKSEVHHERWRSPPRRF